MVDTGGLSGGYKSLLLPGLAAVVLIGLWIAKGSIMGDTDSDAPAPAKGADTKTKTATGAKASSGTPAANDDVDGTAVVHEGPTKKTRPRSRAQRDAMLAKLKAAVAARERASESGDEEPKKSPPDLKAKLDPPVLDKDYIRQQIRDELVPLAHECYQSALEDNPELGGKLVLEFSIIGEEEIGGVVEEVSIGDGSEIKHPEMQECMRESMYTVSFEPPEGGGTVQVTYPLVFAPG